MKDAAEEDEDDKDNTDDNRESISLVQDEVLLMAHFPFSIIQFVCLTILHIS